MTAREVVEIGIRGGAAVLGRLDDIGSLGVGNCTDFFSIGLTVDFAGALHDSGGGSCAEGLPYRDKRPGRCGRGAGGCC
jgi:hypothetical protein